jgi:hypothetical protein
VSIWRGFVESSVNLDRELEKIRRRRQGDAALRDGILQPLRVALPLFVQLRSFLIWSALLAVFELVEVWILLEKYHTFLVGGALGVLRLVAVARLLPLAALIGLRTLVPLRTPGRREIVLGIANGFLVISTVIALVLVAWLTFFTDFYASASPFVRAIVLAGIVALPFESFSTLLIFNFNTLTSRPLPRPIRLITYGCILGALAALWGGFSSGYFVLRLLGAVVLPIAMVSILGWEVISPRLGLARLERIVAALYATVVRGRAPTSGSGVAWFSVQMAGLYFVWEMAFFHWSMRFKEEQAVSLLLFVLHKVAHFSSLLSFRFLLRHIQRLGRVVRAQVQNEIRRVVNLLDVATVWCVSIGFVLMVPFALVKERLILGHLPLSSSDSSLTLSVVLAGAMFLFSFGLGSTHLFLLGVTVARGLKSAVMMIVIGVFLWWSSGYAAQAALYENVEGALVVLFLSSAALNVLICLMSRFCLLRMGGSGFVEDEPVPNNFETLSAFASSSRGQAVLIVESSQRVRESRVVVDLDLPSTCRFTTLLGRFVLIRPHMAEPEQGREATTELADLVARVAARAERYRVVRLALGIPREWLRFVLEQAFPSLLNSSNASILSNVRVAPGVVRVRRLSNGWTLPDSLEPALVAPLVKVLGLLNRFKDSTHVAALRGETVKCFLIEGDSVYWIPSELRSDAVAAQGIALRDALCANRLCSELGG